MNALISLSNTLLRAVRLAAGPTHGKIKVAKYRDQVALNAKAIANDLTKNSGVSAKVHHSVNWSRINVDATGAFTRVIIRLGRLPVDRFPEFSEGDVQFSFESHRRLTWKHELNDPGIWDFLRQFITASFTESATTAMAAGHPMYHTYYGP